MQPIPKILSDITKSVSASGVQFFITLITTPLMTRLYSPDAYATFGIVNTTATLMVAVGCASLPSAYPLEKDAYQRTALIRAMLLLLGSLVLLGAITATVLIITDWFHVSIAALLLLPVLVLTFGIRQIMVAVATAQANFSAMALGQVLEPACSRGITIALGAALGGHPAFILASVATGHVATTITITRMAARGVWKQWRALFTCSIGLRATLRRSLDFVIYNTFSQQAQPLVMLGLQLTIAALFSKHMAGQYMLAVSILTLPVSLVAMTSSSVVYRHFIEVERTNPAMLSLHLQRSLVRYLLVGTLIMMPVVLYSETIFTVAFGQTWHEAGKIAGILGFAYIITFTLMGIQSIFRVTRTLKIQFWWEVTSCAALLGIAVLCFNRMEFYVAIACLSALWFVRNALLLCIGVRVASRHRVVTIWHTP